MQQIAPGVFKMEGDLAVRILTGNRWLPPPDCVSGWRPMHSHKGLRHRVTALGCTYGWEQTEAMLDAALHEHGKEIQATFDVRDGTCFAVRQAYLTETNAGHEKDDLHSDICDNHARLAMRRDADPTVARVGLTIIGYPHTRWHASWGGPTEFVPGACDEMEEAVAAGIATFADYNARRPSLRVDPLPNRTVVFRAELLHRATRPRGVSVGVATDGFPPGNRWATVLRVLCETAAAS